MIDPNQPAFPVTIPVGYSSGGNIDPNADHGLTIRAELAARNLEGIYSQHGIPPSDKHRRIFVKEAISGADELIRQLNEQKEQDRIGVTGPPEFDEFDNGMSEGH